MKTISKKSMGILSGALLLGVLCFQSLAGQTARLIVEHSTDLSDWQEVEVTPEMLDEGHILHDLSGDKDFFRLILDLGGEGPEPTAMVLVEGGVLPESSGMSGVAVADFLVARYEVTWGEWKEVRAWAVTRGYDLAESGLGCADNHPVHSISWYEAIKWCNAKSEMEGLTPVYRVGGAVYRSGETDPDANFAVFGYRLPREAEWEFAARGGNESNNYTYAGGNNLDAVGWYWENSAGAACPLSSDKGTWPVGLKAPNELGLYDMSGNVREWCWEAAYSNRRTRGGAWSKSSLHAELNYRAWTGNKTINFDNGLRLFRTP